jgi:hypothetical protein
VSALAAPEACVPAEADTEASCPEQADSIAVATAKVIASAFFA